MAASSEGTAQIYPGKGLGFLLLGASLHEILSRLRSHTRVYPSINIIYDAKAPIASPVVLDLENNGIRLRFDGADQRLRLIEILDITKSQLSYNGVELVKVDGHAPNFRSIYNKIFGPTFPGEYVGEQGMYVLSYPGIAFSFPVDRTQWSDKIDFVSLLSSNSAQPAKSLAIYTGKSWSEAREDLYRRAVPAPRLPTVNAQSARISTANDEIELIRIHSDSKIELMRRHNNPFLIKLHSTTVQDLIAEIGPPSAIYRKSDHRLSIHRTSSNAVGAGERLDDTDEFMTDHIEDLNTDNDTQDDDEDCARELSSKDYFYNYFQHGFDIFISTSSSSSTSLSHVATKLILHGNIPGSYDFQRYRRARWTIEYAETATFKEPLTSEMGFDDILGRLGEKWGIRPKPMLLNKANDSPSSSVELLGGWEEGEGQLKDDNSSFGSTELYGFPGLIFEVLPTGAVSSLTVF